MKKILIFSTYYVPSIKGGGPIQSIQNIVDNLSNDFEFYIITSDRDLGDNESYNNISLNSWVTVGKAKVCYVNMKRLELFKFISTIKSIDYDLIYLNSFFSFKFSILPVILSRVKAIPLKRVVLAPRGEFSLGALKLKKVKKSLFIFLVKSLSLYKKIYWHATAEEEKNDIKRVFGNNSDVKIAPNLTKDYSALKYSKKVKKTVGDIKIIFISRIHPKKNLIQAIKFLNKIKGNVEFNIYGPIEDSNYWAECERTIKKLPSNISVHYYGLVKHEDIIDIFRGHHIFLFPTLGENFGHVISEALIGGCPIIISDRTPWRHLDNIGIGYDIELDDLDKYVEKIQYFVDMNNQEFEIYSKNSFCYGKNYSKHTNSYENTKKIFE